MKDPMLLGLILMAGQKEPLEQDVTLNVGGFLVSGYVVSYERYVKHHQTTEALDIAFEQLSKTPNPEPPELLDNTPNYIHLRDAKYYLPGVEPIPGNMGLFVRVPLTSVHGFSFGKLEAASK